jgi:hypothetical protein
MSDVFISHAREDRADRERLSDALRAVGVSAAWASPSSEKTASKDRSEKDIESASAIISFWSARALLDERVTLNAQRAIALKPKDPASLSSRYIGFIIDETEQDALPEPFRANPAEAWQSWFRAPDIAFDDSRFIGLLTTLEILTGRKQFLETARALAIRDAETVRLKAQIQARDHALSQSQSDKTLLETQIRQMADATAKADIALSDRDARIAALTQSKDALDAERLALSAALDSRTQELSTATQSAATLRSTLETVEATLRETSALKAALETQLEDARAGLDGALRQQAAMRGEIHAADENLRAAVLEREGLRDTIHTLETKRAKLTAQLSDTATRLADMDQRRATYEAALVQRKKEIDQLTDQTAAASAEIGQLGPQVQKLTETVKSWGHVPWRSIAAGSLAAGLVVASGGFMIARAMETWFSAPPQTAAVTPPAPADASAGVQSEILPVPPKSGAQVGPDTLQVVETQPVAAEGDPQAPDSDPGAISIPDDSAVPSSNDQVEFNPDGLPPVDPDSRPPPQDLPPMQQKPRLLLKPQAPPSSVP